MLSLPVPFGPFVQSFTNFLFSPESSTSAEFYFRCLTAKWTDHGTTLGLGQHAVCRLRKQLELEKLASVYVQCLPRWARNVIVITRNLLCYWLLETRARKPTQLQIVPPSGRKELI